MSLTMNLVSVIVAILLIIVAEILCGDPSFNASNNAWPKLPNQRQSNPSNPSWRGNQKTSTTTPWPALGQQPRRQNSNNNNNNNNNNPVWVRPNSNSLRPLQNNNNINNNNQRGPAVPGNFNNNLGQRGSNFNQQNSENSAATDDELREFSEILLSKDVNNAARYVNINFQGKTTSRSEVDEAPAPLMTISQEAYQIPSVEKIMLLYNNYILDSTKNEHYTAQEKIEESNLLDTILSTPIMQQTRNFLIEKGKIGRDPKEFKDLLKEIWFNMYSRGGGRIGSSGFEHVFLAEIKNNQVSGLHNWIYFNEEEKSQHANYLGYLKKIDLGNKGAILKYHFKFQGIDKPVGSMFIGTSPEFEMALYTTCFMLRADQVCPLKLNNNKFIIRTYTYRYRGKNMIGSAFPEI